MTDRLGSQLVALKRRELDIAFHRQRIAHFTAEMGTAQKTTTLFQVEGEKLLTLKARLAQHRESLIADLDGLVKDDELARKELSENLQKEIERVNVAITKENELMIAAADSNAVLKQKLVVLNENTAAGTDKMSQLVGQRAREGEQLQQRLEEVKQQNEVLTSTLAEIQSSIESEQRLHDVRKAEAEVHMAEFGVVQEKLRAANKLFVVAKADNDALGKKIALVENQHGELKKRLERAVRDRNAEDSALTKLNAQVGTLEAQTKKLLDLSTALLCKMT